jgi:two-component system cell cycle sensor histidine kinase/response regulator CckA
MSLSLGQDRQPEKRGSETILLVEDDDGVRHLVKLNLEKQGYTILDAGNGQAAIDLLEGYNGPLHLVITDVVMPVMDGRQLVDRLLVRLPDLKVLYVSGYSNDILRRLGIEDDTPAFLQKPFMPPKLIERVRLLLDADR